MVKKEKKRDSNFELLRIFAMLIIIIHHIFCHVIKMELSSDYIYGPFEMFNNAHFYRRLCILEFPLIFGKVGDSIFILITGYFLTERKKIDITKQSIKVLSQILFVTIFLIIISIIVPYLFDIKVTSLPNIIDFNNQWWFIGYYLTIIVIGQYVLNKRLCNITKKQYLSFLIIVFIFASLFFTRSILSSLSPNIPTLLIGVFLYSLGGFIKKYNPFKSTKNIYFILIIFFCYAIDILSYRNDVLVSINKNIINNNPIYYQTFKSYEDYNLIPVLIGICTFELFRRIKIKNSKIINRLASSTLMIYLLHDNPYIRSVLRNIDFIKLLKNDIISFIMIYIALTFLIFVVSYFVYEIYKCLFEKIVKTFTENNKI